MQRTGTGTGLVTLRDEVEPALVIDDNDTSALGESFEVTPMVVPIRGHWDSIKRLLKGDRYIGRGSRQRSLGKSRYCKTFKVSQYGRSIAISSFRDALLGDRVLYPSLWTLSGTRLECHCRHSEPCHGDVLIEEFKKSFPDAFDRYRDDGVPPDSRILSFMARLREEPESDEGSSPDECAPPKNSGLCGGGQPMKVGVGFSQRDFCDGQSLAPPRRWPPGSRVYPSSHAWTLVVDCFMRFTNHHGTEQLLVSLAMGKIDSCPFPLDDVAELKRSVIGAAAGFGHQIVRKPGDRSDVPIDYRFLDLYLRVAEDPETGLGEYAQGAKVGPGTRMPRLPALYKPKKKWRLASQVDPLDYLEHAPDKEGTWRSNYSTLQAFEQQVLEVMYDRASRGQVIVLSERGGKRQASELGYCFTRCSAQGEASWKAFCTRFVRRNARPLCQFQNETQGPREGADCWQI